MADDQANDRHRVSHWQVSPDQSDVRPMDRTIGEGIRSDGPNGQSSTPQNGRDSVADLQGAGEGVTPQGNDQGWLAHPSLMAEGGGVPELEEGEGRPR